QAEHQYKFDVKMTCGGCSGAVDRVLKKTEGVTSYDISLEKQEVLVNGTIAYDDLLAKIKKTGKEVRNVPSCILFFADICVGRTGPLGSNPGLIAGKKIWLQVVQLL
ncbi:hypothetical protein PLICRDRAFT_110679, partial [Plicaturopsis crispa FD-325 SS-3]